MSVKEAGEHSLQAYITLPFLFCLVTLLREKCDCGM